MSIAEQDIAQIEVIVQRIIENNQVEVKSSSNVFRYDLELCERSIRVEEELKHQRELMSEGFKQMEKRFEQQHQKIMGIHHEIKLLMRWVFGVLIGTAGLIVAVLRLAG